MSDAEIAAVRLASPGFLYIPEEEIEAGAGIGRILFLRVTLNMGEGDFTRLVIGIAKAQDVLVHHCGTATTCEGGPGLPDLTFAGRHRVLFAELKRLWRHEIVPDDWGTRSAEQEGWADRLGDRCVLWTPLDLLHIPEDLLRLNISF